MAAPKLKLYLLPPTYTEVSDDDVKLLQEDELIPLFDKAEALETVKTLTGVWPGVNLPCYPIAYDSGRFTAAFSADESGLIFTPDIVAPSGILVGPSGEARFKLYDGLNELPLATYTINTDDSGIFQSITLISPPSGSVTGNYYGRAPTPWNQWAIPASTPYDGPNYAVTKIIVALSGHDYPSTVPARYDPRDNTSGISLAGPSGSIIRLPHTANGLRITYWWEDPLSNYFAADDAHWVHEHMRLNPDIFVGNKDYPGDQGEVNGEPFVQGVVPQFREVGTYQINYNEGWVKFPELIDSRVFPVRANYAYMVGIRQAKRAFLQPTAGAGGLKWKLPAVPQDWPEASGKSLVNRNDTWLPRIIWVNGAESGATITVTPYEVLTAKLS